VLVVRTPDERFDNLPDFPFEPHYAKINGRRVHFLRQNCHARIKIAAKRIQKTSHKYAS